MSRDYASRRRAETMDAYRPGETPDTDHATIYEQRWRRVDGTSARGFTVLALDAEQAEQLGRLRLAGKYRQDPEDWELVTSSPWLRITSMVVAVLMAETEAERQCRAEAHFARMERVS
jgi:hypothetical protein